MASHSQTQSPAHAQAHARADEDWLREIGRRVLQLRRARGLTQKALARKARLSESHVYRIEQGFNMGVGTLLAVGRALDVAPQAFFNADGAIAADSASAYQPLDGPRPQMRETAVERVSTFVQGLKADERRRAMRLLRAAFPDRDRY
ncbi:MAG: helix-turn-helix transcriptional regulator [Deltaproteobacteria bacterium]|nr:helix-turn-helix transcriptional regulator [Deltaproteobacteria bacterium]